MFRLPETLNYPVLCWRGNTAGHKQSEKFLKCVDNDFLTRVIEEPSRKDVLLVHIFTNKEELVGDVKIGPALATVTTRSLVEVEVVILEDSRVAEQIAGSQPWTSGKQSVTPSEIPFYCWIYTNMSNILLLLYPLTLQPLICSSPCLFGQGWNCELLGVPQHMGYMSRLFRHSLT